LGTSDERTTRSTAEAPAIAAASTKRIQTGGGPVGEGAAEERGDDQGAQLGGADQAGEEGRAGDHGHLQGQRDQGRLGAEAGDQRARGEQPEVARLAQGLDVHRYPGEPLQGNRT
jgi:hypothetical protein